MRPITTTTTPFLLPLLSLLLTTTTTTAQSLTDVPSCASGPALTSFTSTGCPITEISCICRDQGFLTGLLPVVEAACSPEDLQRTIAFTENLCRDNGVPISITASADASEPTTVTSSSTLPAASASGTGGLGGSGNGTGGGGVVTPTPTPSAAPDSGVKGKGALVNLGLVVGGVVVGAVVLL
ncbi:MAG: hypothetical protein Q9208_008080 [Pyrenodesmia sp. 3 TL-2023]